MLSHPYFLLLPKCFQITVFHRVIKSLYCLVMGKVKLMKCYRLKKYFYKNLHKQREIQRMTYLVQQLVNITYILTVVDACIPNKYH